MHNKARKKHNYENFNELPIDELNQSQLNQSSYQAPKKNMGMHDYMNLANSFHEHDISPTKLLQSKQNAFASKIESRKQFLKRQPCTPSNNSNHGDTK